MNRLRLVPWDKILLVVLLVAITSYLCDYLSLRFRIPNREPLGSIKVHPLIAVKLKGSKTEYISGDAAQQSCSNSLFPQLGNLPCWYVAGHPYPRTDY
jgi:hypothetical protein